MLGFVSAFDELGGEDAVFGFDAVAEIGGVETTCVGRLGDVVAVGKHLVALLEAYFPYHFIARHPRQAFQFPIECGMAHVHGFLHESHVELRIGYPFLYNAFEFLQKSLVDFAEKI